MTKVTCFCVHKKGDGLKTFSYIKTVKQSLCYHLYSLRNISSTWNVELVMKINVDKNFKIGECTTMKPKVKIYPHAKSGHDVQKLRKSQTFTQLTITEKIFTILIFSRLYSWRKGADRVK